MKDKINIVFNNSLFLYSNLLLLSIAVLFQSPLSPSAIGCVGNDSSIFITIARNILDGDILYKDITDHKGPMIFIMDALGLFLFKGKLIGIWILEIISLWVTSIFTYKTANLLYDKIISFTSTILSILFIVPILLGGNLTEEWCLPYIAIAIYLFIKYLKNNSLKAFKPYELFILSFTFIIAFLFKASYIGVWVAFGITIISKLVINKQWKTIISYLLQIVIYCLITLIPFFIYFYHHDALKDAICWMLEFNMQYGSSTFSSSLLSTLQIIVGIRHLPVIVILSVMFAVYNDDWIKNRYIFIGFILAIIITAYSCAIGNRYEHYNIIFAPLLVLTYGYLFNYLCPDSFNKKLAIFILAMGSGYIFTMKQIDSRNYNPIFSNTTITEVANLIKKHSKPDDTIMGDPFVDRAIYVYANRKCLNKYQCNSYAPDITEEVINKKPSIFIHNRKTYMNDTILILYFLKDSYNQYDIYEINKLMK